MNGIQAYSSSSLASILLSGYSQINSLKLSQALSNKSVSAISAVTSQDYSYSSSLSYEASSFLKDYQSQMLALRDTAEAAMRGGTVSRKAAGAEDISVAEVSGELASASDSYTLTVEQLATGQINRSTLLESSDPMPSMGGSLRITTAQGSTEIYMSAAGAENNKEMLEKFASRINERAAYTGVTASVEEDKNGMASLVLEGATGQDNSFSVSGTLAERLGLDNVVQSGQDAIYSIQKNGGEVETYGSESNSVLLDGRLAAHMKQEGTTEIRAGADKSSALADTLSGLIAQYNETVSFLNRNEDYGVGALNQLKRMITPPVSERTLNSIGVSYKSDGTLSFDRATFVEQAQKSPSLVNGIVESFAEDMYSDAKAGLQEKSGSLLSNMQSSSSGYGSTGYSIDSSALEFLNLYNRGGAYNMTNYYMVGLLMNLNA